MSVVEETVLDSSLSHPRLTIPRARADGQVLSRRRKRQGKAKKIAGMKPKESTTGTVTPPSCEMVMDLPISKSSSVAEKEVASRKSPIKTKATAPSCADFAPSLMAEINFPI